MNELFASAGMPNRFLNWRLIDGRKVPCRADGTICDAHDPANHTDFATASASPFGVAFDIRKEDGLYFLDLDKCFVDGDWTPEAKAIFTSFTGAWGEVSQSGAGLHIIGRCDPAKLADRRNKFNGWQEFYTDQRFVAFGSTGWQFIGGGEPSDRDFTDLLLKVVPQREHLGELPKGVDTAYTGPADDNALIDMMLRSGSAGSAFGQKASAADLWRADAAKLAKYYPAFDAGGGFDHSSADAALMAHLAFWTGKDMPRMDRLFRLSKLMREKYETRADYRRDTVQNAARLCKNVYDRPAPVAVVQGDEHGGVGRSQFFCAADLVGKPVPPREWLVQDWVPSGTVTLLGGDGGTGKSLIALQLTYAVATGGTWLGRNVARGGALFISAEDDMAELHRRLADLVHVNGATFDSLNRLTLCSLAGKDALLATLDRSGGVLHTTALFSEIDKRIADERPALVVLDTLADMFPGNENDRAQARHFIGILRGIANRYASAVLLLAHPSLSGMSTGTGTSGSTAWNNSGRSRLYFSRIFHDGQEDNPDRRLLSTKKANYGRIGGEISVTWRNGVFLADIAAGLDSKIADDSKAERVFLRLLDEFTKEGRAVKSARANGYAPKEFAVSGRTEGVSKQALHSAMELLFAKGEIIERLGGHTSPSKQTLRIVRAKTIWGAEPMLNPLLNPLLDPLLNPC